MANFVAAGIIILMIGLAIGYIIKEKKKGTVCIGCPHAGNCGSKGESSCVKD